MMVVRSGGSAPQPFGMGLLRLPAMGPGSPLRSGQEAAERVHLGLPKSSHNATAQPMRPSVYIMTNQKRGTLYTGVTSSLVRRVWYDVFERMPEALRRRTWDEALAPRVEDRADREAEPRLA